VASTFFISDVHLGLQSRSEEKAKARRLVAFLEHVAQCGERLFIVGDLFDTWFEYRTVIPKGFHRILTKLEDLTEHGLEVHYLAGNHDFWMLDYFSLELRVQTHRDPITTIVQGKKILLHHGDGLAAGDSGYRFLKRVLRNPVNVWLYRWIHPDIGIALARSSSKKSRHYTSGKSYGDDDGMIRFAHDRIHEGYDIVIMGHRHDPLLKAIEGGIYVNLGDWITHNTYAELTEAELHLRTWS
jgi:UDP-2,3-diacylglucosamine hydrolase